MGYTKASTAQRRQLVVDWLDACRALRKDIETEADDVERVAARAAEVRARLADVIATYKLYPRTPGDDH